MIAGGILRSDTPLRAVDALAPTLTSVSPVQGSINGGETATLTGNFCGGATVYTDANGVVYCAQESLTFGGHEYINTGIDATGDTTVQVDYMLSPEADNPARIFGVFGNGTDNNFLFQKFGDNLLWYYGASGYTTIAPADTERHTVVADNGDLYLDGNLMISRPGSMINSNSIFLGALNNGGESPPAVHFGGQIYSFSIHKSGQLTIDFIPACNLLTGACGMFDRVSETFFASASSTPFTNLAPFSATFDDSVCTNPQILSSTTAICVIPSHVTGKVAVALYDMFGDDTLANGYEYVANCEYSSEILSNSPDCVAPEKPDNPDSGRPIVPGSPDTGV
jgi:hypothetical protein